MIIIIVYNISNDSDDKRSVSDEDVMMMTNVTRLSLFYFLSSYPSLTTRYSVIFVSIYFLLFR